MATLGQARDKADWQVLSFCLMSSHFHPVVETPRAKLVAGMKWPLGTYTARFQPEAQAFRALVFGAPPGAAGGRRQHALPQEGLRLRPPESRARSSGRLGQGLAVLPLEQLPDENVSAERAHCGGPPFSRRVESRR
jgi:hypothetical protein